MIRQPTTLRQPPMLRASGMPLAFKCPGSLVPPSIPIAEDGYEAAVGTAVHAVLRSLAEKGDVEWHRIPDVAAAHGVEADDVLMLVRMARVLWPSLAESFANAQTEVPLIVDLGDGVTLSGHADLLSLHDTIARGADWKTGRSDGDYGAQMRAYAALIMLENPQLVEVTFTVVWIREGEIENYTMDSTGLSAWLTELRSRVIAWDGVYHPGKHCRYCPRSHECDARNALVRADIAALRDKGLADRMDSTLSLMRPEQIIELHRQAESVLDNATRVRAAIKAHVIARGDILGSGTRLTITTQQRRELLPEKAWPLLEDAGFESADFVACIDLHISRVEKTIATKAGRGKGASAVRALTSQLEAAGAINVKEQHTLTVRRT